MSFFVSKALEGKVDENCLIPSEESDTLNKEFVLEIEETPLVCCIRELSFVANQEQRSLVASIDCNIHAIDFLFTNPGSQARIRFKNSALLVEEIKIDNIFKKDGDNYIVGLTAHYTVEE